MSVESSIFTLLTNYPALVALVAQRVYPGVPVQGTAYPCLTYARVSTPRQHAFGAGQPVVSSRPRFQFTAWAPESGGAHSVVDVIAQVRAALLGSLFTVTLDNEVHLNDPVTGNVGLALDALLAHEGE